MPTGVYIRTKPHWNKGICKFPNAENEVHICACGCNQQIAFKSWYRWEGYPWFILGHYLRGHTKENDPIVAEKGKKAGDAMRGRTKETHLYIAARAKKMQGQPTWSKGLTAATDSRIATGAREKRGRTAKTHAYIAIKAKKSSDAQRGRTKEECPYLAAKSKAMTGRTGAATSNWKGGLSFLPYAAEFNDYNKELIRQRDNYTCQKCGVPQIECRRKLAVHHIDYDKENCVPDNLIALCVICNARVNKDREYWTKYFQRKMRQRKLLHLVKILVNGKD